MRGKAVATAAAMVALLATTSGLAAGGSATGTMCGAGSRCVSIPAALAVKLSQRSDAFVGVATPAPAAYYRIKITAKGEGFINRSIVWVPSAKAWYLKEYVTPPNPGYWRNANPATTPGLAKLAQTLQPFPAPTHWVLPH